MQDTQTVGKIVQIIGPVVDVEFAAGHLPEIYNALRITNDAKDEIVAESVRRCRKERREAARIACAPLR